MKNLTPELIEKAKTAKSAEELLALAKANNVEMTEEEAKTYFEQLNANVTVSDEELDAVAGGGFMGVIPPSNKEKNGFKKGDRIMLKNGKKCVCGSRIGICVVPGISAHEATIRCEECKYVMPNFMLLGSIEKI